MGARAATAAASEKDAKLAQKGQLVSFVSFVFPQELMGNLYLLGHAEGARLRWKPEADTAARSRDGPA